MINPVLIIVIPLILAFISLIFKKAGKWILLGGALLNVVMVFFLEKGEVIIGGFKPPFGINLILDNYSLVGVVLAGVLFLAIIVMSFEKTEKYTIVLMTALAGINGMLLTGDLFNLFVFMEITVISAYILSMAGKKPEHSFNYLVLGSVGSVFYLAGLIMLYSVTGTLNMADMAASNLAIGSTALFVPLFLIFTGLAVEAKLMPFGGWVKGVYGNSNRLTGALFASVYAAAILMVFGRIFNGVFVLEGTIQIIIVIIGIMTFIFGETAAFRQKKMRRILLFSSIGQSGLAVTLFALGLVFPAVLVVINNSVGKFIMFTITGKLKEVYDTDDYTKLKGAFYSNKLTGVAFSIAGLSLIGLPLFFGFYAKLNALTALFNGGNWFIPMTMLILAIVEGAYFIRLIIALWAPGNEGEYADKANVVGTARIFNIKKSILIFIVSLTILAAGLLPDLSADAISSGDGFMGSDGPTFNMSQQKGGE